LEKLIPLIGGTGKNDFHNFVAYCYLILGKLNCDLIFPVIDIYKVLLTNRSQTRIF